MERRTAKVSAISVTVTLATASLAIAAVAGGLFAEAATSSNPGVKRVEQIDDYIVVHTTAAETTVAPVTVATDPVATEPATVAPVPETVEITQPLTTSAPPTTAARQPKAAAPTAVAAPRQQPSLGARQHRRGRRRAEPDRPAPRRHGRSSSRL